MKIVIFSGTTEGKRLSRELADAGAEVVVCVASEYGEEEQGSYAGITTRRGPLTEEEKQTLLRDAALCIDATHPYARHVTESVRSACEKAGVRNLRLQRPESKLAGEHVFSSAEEAARWLETREGNILLTTGAKELVAFTGLAPERLFPRVLPNHRSLDACEKLGIPHRNMIAMQGPFSTELNVATIRQYGIRFLVTKDGGKQGGFEQKRLAARQTGIGLLVLQRPEERDAGLDYGAVYQTCMTLLQGSDAK